MSARTTGISVWRVAGLSYNQYAAVALNAFKNALKPEAQAKRRFEVTMKERAFANGKGGEKSEIKDIFTPSVFEKAA